MQPGSIARSKMHKLHNATLHHEGSFTHAHNFKIDMMNIFGYDQAKDTRSGEEARSSQTSQAKCQKWTEEREAKVLGKLELTALPSTMLDSVDRGYVPRCDEQTRLRLRNCIIEWAQEHNQPHHLFWLSGPTAIGKSAVAQTVAETMKDMGFLVAVFFFSQPNLQSNPNTVIATLVLQLFTSIPEYRCIVTDKITHDPTILQKTPDIQFQKLIIDPFLILAKSRIASNAQRILIVLDGLDKCSDRAAQSDFVTIISHHAQLSSQLHFLICSCPEPHLEVAFSKPETQAITVQEKLEVEDTEAQSDAYQLLLKGFGEIRLRYPDQLTDNWPAPAQTRLIADRALGHLGFASFILRFIGDESYDDPSSQLEVSIKFLECSRAPEAINPLHSLDLLYTQILSDIPPAILPTMQSILAFSVFYLDIVGRPWNLCAWATFLGLSQASTYSALRCLHSVMVIPSPTDATHSDLQVYHSSFTDYLKDPARSGKSALDENMLPPISVITRSIKWLDHTHEIPGIPAHSRDVWNLLLPYFPWELPFNDSGNIFQQLTHFSFLSLWRMCPTV
ncbi:hypothetical protein NP233_g1106 [Leucocoprinus birnbaumii]|uniref:Nephrocystin 3-like N-terminal domain-containing protein n=1 Tax=Leucocoprinus birnbaumii TaxID=56174 RepID=A0AAD5W155_9AGAR|nr:hypothetical protein NP233_g1106 [Leucocoprinus birnbaumii]